MSEGRWRNLGSERKQGFPSEQKHVALLVQADFLEVMVLEASLVT